MLTHPSTFFSMKCFIVTPRGFLGGAVIKNLAANIVRQFFSSLKKKKKNNPPANTGYVDSVPGWGRSPGEGNGNPLQYSCLENSMDRRSRVGNSPWGRKELDTTEQNPNPCNIPLMAKSFFSEVLSPG